MKLHCRPIPRRALRQCGFSLVELMVAIVLGLFLIAGLASLLVSNVRTRSELDRSARQIENGRFATELLSEDIQHAGFIGMSSGTLAATLTAPCPANVAALVATYAPAAAPAIASAPTGVYGLNAAPGCVANYKANTAILVVTRLSTANPVTPTAATASANDAFMQVSTCPTETTPFAVAKGDGAFPLTQKDCATVANVRRVVQHVYFVSTCNVCSGGGADTIPTLKMMEYSGGSMVETPLVDGIEDLQFEYGIDTDGNGSPDCYTSNPSSPPAGEFDVALCPAASLPNSVTNWSNVVAVRIHVLARSVDTSGAGWKDTRTYDLGWRITGAATSASTPVGPFNDAYKRHAYSAVARLYNLSAQRS